MMKLSDGEAWTALVLTVGLVLGVFLLALKGLLCFFK